MGWRPIWRNSKSEQKLRRLINRLSRERKVTAKEACDVVHLLRKHKIISTHKTTVEYAATEFGEQSYWLHGEVFGGIRLFARFHSAIEECRKDGRQVLIVTRCQECGCRMGKRPMGICKKCLALMRLEHECKAIKTLINKLDKTRRQNHGEN